MINIFIPTWNNAEQLLGCLRSLAVEAEGHRIHILNNGNQEDDQGIAFEDFVQGLAPETASIHNMDGNRGWQGALNDAYNRGLMDSEFTVICNDDVVFLPYNHILGRLKQHLEHNDNAAAVGPSSNVVMGSQNINNHLLPPLFKTSLLIGFCCMFRTECLKEVVDPNPWDERLPGGDDFDMSIKLRKEGYDLLVDRTSYLHHIGFQTGKRVHGPYWNSTEQRLATDNAIARKHGVAWWFETLQSWIWPMEQSLAEASG